MPKTPAVLKKWGPSILPMAKKLRPTAMATAGFTLISAGSWSIYGQGVGLITGGILTVVLQWWVDSD
ncbi:hypothetical protein OG596_26360 [Streptomyces sp. NBC_01102]|uniref:hypothetical protein n=1 Tax=Streptomyces sp. NBC_01102 TaxID=2903749 RepID=UPI00386A2DBE|nr:hypothetical protein OG596_26360 [Streptomyces sp. NBC_01102]